jgi:hypothetical protein
MRLLIIIIVRIIVSLRAMRHDLLTQRKFTKKWQTWKKKLGRATREKVWKKNTAPTFHSWIPCREEVGAICSRAPQI